MASAIRVHVPLGQVAESKSDSPAAKSQSFSGAANAVACLGFPSRESMRFVDSFRHGIPLKRSLAATRSSAVRNERLVVTTASDSSSPLAIPSDRQVVPCFPSRSFLAASLPSSSGMSPNLPSGSCFGRSGSLLNSNQRSRFRVFSRHSKRPDVGKTPPPPSCAILPETAAEAATLDSDSPRAAAVARAVATAVETADRAALPSGAELAAQLQAQPAQQAQSPPLMKVSPESLTYPSGFLGGFGDNNPLPVDSKGHVAADVAVDKDAYLRQILRSRVYDVAIESALEFAPKLSERIGNRVFLKREDTQPVFSFKLRGAYNMMAHLTPRQLAKGVICSSAGNHAQGVALSASRLHCSAIIAMPVTTPEIKWRAVQRLGAEVVLVGDSYDETQAYAKRRAEEEGRVFIPPFDHELVIAGQGTVGMEILRQWSTCDRTGGCGGGAGQWRFLDSSSEDEREGHGSNGSAKGAVNGAAATAGAAASAASLSSFSPSTSPPSLSSLSPAAAASLLSSESPEQQQQQLSQAADLVVTSHSSPFFPPPPTPVSNTPSSLSSMLSQAALAAAGEGEGLCHMDPSSLHAVFVPVGGGGLIAGIAAYIKALQPEVRVIGVEPADANAMALSLYHGRRVELSSCGTFADGVAVRQVGEETFRLSQQLVDGVVLVSRDEICAAIKDMFEDTRSILEPAGALALAGAKAYCRQYGLKGEGVVAVTSGANMNFDRLRLVSELADLGARREAVLATTLPEIPGAFKQFAKLVGASMNITEFKYRFCSTDAAHVLYSVGVHTEEDLQAMILRLEDGDMPTVDMTDNDLAKDHLRHLVGGRSSLPNEILFRFVFPERPGALVKFLDPISPRWNITLFHYRRTGEMIAHVLVGLQVMPHEEAEFRAVADALGYEYSDERNNKALRIFMQ